MVMPCECNMFVCTRTHTHMRHTHSRNGRMSRERMVIECQKMYLLCVGTPKSVLQLFENSSGSVFQCDGIQFDSHDLSIYAISYFLSRIRIKCNIYNRVKEYIRPVFVNLFRVSAKMSDGFFFFSFISSSFAMPFGFGISEELLSMSNDARCGSIYL